MENDMEKKNDKGYTKTGMYNKRPLWQWIIFYVAVAGLAYGLIFYVFIGRRNIAGASSGSSLGSSSTTQPMPYYPAY